MLKRISLLIIAMSFSTLLQAQQSSTKDQQKVQQTVINFFESLSNRDSVTLKSHCATDIILFEYGQLWNLDTLIRKAIKRNATKDYKRVNDFDFIKTLVDKDMAWVSYNLQSEIMKDGKQSTIRWLETVVLVRKQKKWKLKVLHSTMVNRS